MVLECKNLMLGNWVKTDITEPQRVEAIFDGNQVMLAYRDIYFNWEIEPVPLTDDILERNGWVRSGAKYNHADVKGEILVWTDGDYMVEVRSPKKYLGSFSIHYVHELQQLFNLCGIEVDIDVFAKQSDD